MTKGKETKWDSRVKEVSFQMFPEGSDRWASSFLVGKEFQRAGA